MFKRMIAGMSGGKATSSKLIRTPTTDSKESIEKTYTNTHDTGIKNNTQKPPNLYINNPFADSLMEAPPAYDLTYETGHVDLPQRGATTVSDTSRNSTNEDKYSFLSVFDTVFVIDDSESMKGPSWREAGDALAKIAPICTSRDPDGIDIYFLNHRSIHKGTGIQAEGGYYQIREAKQVKDIFESIQPSGSTPTGSRLQHILKPYITRISCHARYLNSTKPINIIVITDGCPTDDPEAIIEHHAKKLDQIEALPHQVGIQFFQVGNEPGAGTALRKLDDDIAGCNIRDMVDTFTWDASTSDGKNELTEEGILKAVLGAVVRRLDRKTLS
ncbi:von Willebrand factor A-like domain superfamily [Fusarium oxysporum f. sp. vasinfectum]|uniref:VWFA domain-containing protein n=1 Tax=Fusarium oxysporum f. sp. vasinfectum 25433 TaxID=1089449 RepID=X0M008_FUSOX|nr:hypothetical protein FOTG_17526 [Fusarium oxysporum f. sp. vasinfectum 25433]KAK2666158.1 von Willebrand factor A-like domain superfamily [Fusarium oxysporum f. sp. vasinfectum]KAK2922430.1 von Willebrand factor, type A [Fusarium oxysporum f. sp. vasinfectum]